MDVTQELHRYRPEIERALGASRGHITYRDLPGLIEAGKLVLYSNDGAVLICEPIPLPQGWMLCMFVTAGEMQHALALAEQAERDAIRLGAVAISAIGRPGWERVLKKRGYRVETVIMAKELQA